MSRGTFASMSRVASAASTRFRSSAADLEKPSGMGNEGRSEPSVTRANHRPRERKTDPVLARGMVARGPPRVAAPPPGGEADGAGVYLSRRNSPTGDAPEVFSMSTGVPAAR
jgi:hypothetical protein